MTVSLMRIPQKPEKNSTLGLTGWFRVGLTAGGFGSWLLGAFFEQGSFDGLLDMVRWLAVIRLLPLCLTS